MRTTAIVFLFTLAVFFLTGKGNHTQHHFFVPLAQAFLQGRLYVDQMQPELHEMVSTEEIATGVFLEPRDGAKGKFFVIFPPLPAVLLMPEVVIWGASTNQSYFSILLASISVVLAYLTFKEIAKDEFKAIVLAFLYAFGSMLWYHAIIGSGWYYSQVCGLLFLWAAIFASLKKVSPFLIGILIGLAYLSRYSLLLAFPSFLFFTQNQWLTDQKINFKYLGKLILPFLLFVLVSLVYNWSRYGRLGHYGYALLEKRPYNINNEYAYGSYSLSYLPRTLNAMLWSFPAPIKSWPFYKPNYGSMALWLVFPAIFIIISSTHNKTLAKASWLGILLILPTSLFHGGVGATQFGFRYALDFMPFLLILIALAVRIKFHNWQKLLIILSVMINIWGVLSQLRFL